MPKPRLRIFVLDGPDARLRLLTVTKVPADIVSRPRRLTVRIGPHSFCVHDGGRPGSKGAGPVFDVPSIGTAILTYPVALCSDDPDVLVMTEAKFRKLIVDHIVNPEIYDDDEEEEEDDDLPAVYHDASTDDDDGYTDDESDDDENREDDEDDDEDDDDDEDEFDPA